MSRLFAQHALRGVEDLGGAWDYYFPVEGTTIEPAAWREGRRETLQVPGCWEMLDGYKTYRGQAVARRVITLTESAQARLVFKGVSHTARVLIDGVERATHHNAYTAFTVEAGELDAGEHEVLVHISNEHGEISALHIPNDYYNYGGISRPVELQLLKSDVAIDYLHITTVPAGATGGKWRAECRARVTNYSAAEQSVSLQALLEGETVSTDVTLAPGINDVEWQMELQGVQPWSPATPQLYYLTARLHRGGEVIDDLIERFGFRTVAVEGETIILNGEAIYPMGFNRHEDHPVVGCAIGVDIMRADLHQMLAMNANSVRTSHYPNDERFLDLCDEMGVLVWEENHARGLELKDMQHPRFREQCARVNEEMIRDHFNHPSIYIWGILNECDSASEEGATMYREQFDQLRALDTTRPLTFASCQFEKDSCQGMVDVCSWNIYPRWYNEESVSDYVEKMIERREKEGMQGKPLIFSEFGAGAISNYHDPIRRARWSEERQCDILEEQLEVMLNHPRVGGVYIWQYCDVRVADEKWGVLRPRTMNNKGIVDENRRPKLAYEVVKRLFAKKR